MVEQIAEIVKLYEERLRGLPFVPRFSFGRRVLREDGASNRLFLTYLFSDGAIAMIFLKDCFEVRCSVTCDVVRLTQSF